MLNDDDTSSSVLSDSSVSQDTVSQDNTETAASETVTVESQHKVAYTVLNMLKAAGVHLGAGLFITEFCKHLLTTMHPKRLINGYAQVHCMDLLLASVFAKHYAITIDVIELCNKDVLYMDADALYLAATTKDRDQGVYSDFVDAVDDVCTCTRAMMCTDNAAAVAMMGNLRLPVAYAAARAAFTEKFKSSLDNDAVIAWLTPDERS